jgi:hypothetical protein
LQNRPQIAPKEAGVHSKEVLDISDLHQRAEGVLTESDKIGCRCRHLQKAF